MDYASMTLEELREALEDARGESGACSDRDCGCHRVPATIEEELDYRGDAAM